MTDPLHPQDYEITRFISNRVASEDLIPSVQVPVNPEDAGLFKNEVAINSYGTNELVNQAPGIWLRVGPGERELATDKLVRIGNVLVTDDLETATHPSVPFPHDAATLVWTGVCWFRKSDNAYFVHNGEEFYRITPVSATQLEEGIARFSTPAEVLAETNTSTTISPADLGAWRTDLELVQRQRTGNEIYVNQITGDDSIENDGKDSRYPYLTINRALLEVARLSYVEGQNNDILSGITIVVYSGDYMLDNRPGSVDYTALTRMSADAVGPINPVTLAAAVTNVTFDTEGRTVLTVDNGATQGVLVNTQVWNTDGSSSGIVHSVSDTEIVLRYVRGSWANNDLVRFANYSSFNPSNGGVVVPRGCSIVGIDLRKCKIRPLHIGNFDGWLADITGNPCDCSFVGSTHRFLVTGNSYIANLTFLDNPTKVETHHLCIAVGFASNQDLSDSSSGYYQKIYQILGNTTSPTMVLADLQANALESSIVSVASNNTSTDSFGLRLIDDVKGASPYISNCSLLSRFGARGLRVDGSSVTGFRSMVVERFTNVSLQTDERAFELNNEAPGGKSYKEPWRHVSYEATNNGYAQLVSCFTIGSAVHYQTSAGGELSLANSFVNFGDLAFDSKGYNVSPFPQDEGASSFNIIPPRPIVSRTQSLILGSLRVEASTTTKLFVYDDELTEERIDPFTILGGETLYLQDPVGTVYTCEIVDTAPFFGSQEVNGEIRWYINVKSLNNNIYAAGETIDSYLLYIERTPDTRSPGDRIYWLEVRGLEGNGKREPQRNYIVKYNPVGSPNFTLESPLFIAAVRDTDHLGNPLPNGYFHIALMSANGPNDPIGELYPPLDLDRPDPNPATSKTYQAMDKLMESMGASPANRQTLLVHGTAPINLVNESGSPQSVVLDFVKPSTIRAFGTGIEWIGYGNYSSALPKYQDFQFGLTGLFSKIKRERYGGRVYNVGMTDDGKFIIGDTVVDLSGGEEVDMNLPFEDTSKVLKNLTVTNRLFMYPGSRMQLGGITVAYDSTTSFQPPISTDFSVYGNNANAGFVRFATQSEANLLAMDNVAISPATIPKATLQQQGIARFATQFEANSIVNDPSDTVSLDSLYLMLSPATLPISSQTQIGAVRAARPDEAQALQSTTTYLSPGTLPLSTEDQIGVTEYADQEEANALQALDKAVTPGRIPIASQTQQGVTKFATETQVESYSEDYVALRPSDVKAIARLLQKNEIGICKLYAGAEAPDGYLFCRGQEISRSTYSDLFAKIGTIWGPGDGSSTFNLPPSNRAIVSAGTAVDYLNGVLGGQATVTATTTEVGEHNHTVTVQADGAHTHVTTVLEAGAHTPIVTVQLAGTHAHNATSGQAGAFQLTANTLINPEYTPVIVIQDAGEHVHVLEVQAGGSHTHTASSALAGGHTPSVTVLSDGGHTHYAVTSDWGPHTFTGYSTFASGAHNHGTYVQEAGEHTHTISISENGAHNHGTYAQDSGSHSHTITTDQAGGHSHASYSEDNGSHSHFVTNSPAGGHGHGTYAEDNGAHAHSTSTEPAGGHNHGTYAEYAGEHGHSVPCPEAGAHTHVLSGGYGVGGDSGATAYATAATNGAHSHGTQALSEGSHSHTIVNPNVADHTHGSSASVEGLHSHNIVTPTVADHNHDAVSSVEGLHNHAIVTPPVESHTHGATSSTEGLHAHVIVTPDADDHAHTGTNTSNGAHIHTVVTPEAAAHTHSMPDMILPTHNHDTVTVESGIHTHGLTIATVPDHLHTLTVNPVSTHSHAITSTTEPDHIHGVLVSPIPGHTHDVSVQALPDHTHLITVADDGEHAHDLVISEVPNHTHNLTMQESPTHVHAASTANNGLHTHQVTTSTIQPYMAMNVIIYTGVHST